MYTASGPTKQLSLTEELEKLEQSITLTLQEIDHNFNRCHRIVTHSILPIIDRFSEESSKVQEGSVVGFCLSNFKKEYPDRRHIYSSGRVSSKEVPTYQLESMKVMLKMRKRQK